MKRLLNGMSITTKILFALIASNVLLGAILTSLYVHQSRVESVERVGEFRRDATQNA